MTNDVEAKIFILINKIRYNHCTSQNDELASICDELFFLVKKLIEEDVVCVFPYSRNRREIDVYIHQDDGCLDGP